jgi:hypothetical protein
LAISKVSRWSRSSALWRCGAVALSLMIVFGTASLTIGWGLLRLRPWTRLGAIVLVIFGLIVFSPLDHCQRAVAALSDQPRGTSRVQA